MWQALQMRHYQQQLSGCLRCCFDPMSFSSSIYPTSPYLVTSFFLAYAISSSPIIHICGDEFISLSRLHLLQLPFHLNCSS
jgi:hypothetical protein